MALLILAWLSGSFLPRVADPWPKSVGLELPLTLSGSGAVLASVVFAFSSSARRDRAIRLGGALGFLVGMGLYLISLIVQVGF
jgi:hypothetical protein